MKKENLEVLISAKDLKKRIKELADEISTDYKGRKPVFVSILKGGGFFLADLVREMKLDLTLDYIAASSYGEGTESSGNVRILKDLSAPIDGKDVIIVEDIIDTGYTLKAIRDMLKARKASSVKVCVLLDKPDRRKVDVSVDYLGFTIPDLFVVGYGIDFAERYRNLPYIAVLKES